MTEPKRRGRPPKARLEGEAMPINAKVAAEYKAALANSVPAASEDFASFVELFKTEHAELWESMRLCPLESGIAVMIERLK
jgi:hypothetical protein